MATGTQIVSTAEEGVAKSWHAEKGFGFVTWDSEELYCGLRDCSGGSLVPGQVVRFDVVQSKKTGRRRAINVNGPGVKLPDEPAEPQTQAQPGLCEGVVRAWKNDKGFGFISCRPALPEGDVFVHCNDLPPGMALREGRTVRFDCHKDPRAGGKSRAQNVSGEALISRGEADMLALQGGLSVVAPAGSLPAPAPGGQPLGADVSGVKQGIVKAWAKKKGTGIIEWPGSKDGIRVHKSALPGGAGDLTVGAEVSFEIAVTEEGRVTASHVTGIAVCAPGELVAEHAAAAAAAGAATLSPAAAFADAKVKAQQGVHKRQLTDRIKGMKFMRRREEAEELERQTQRLLLERQKQEMFPLHEAQEDGEDQGAEADGRPWWCGMVVQDESYPISMHPSGRVKYGNVDAPSPAAEPAEPEGDGPSKATGGGGRYHSLASGRFGAMTDDPGFHGRTAGKGKGKGKGSKDSGKGGGKGAGKGKGKGKGAGAGKGGKKGSPPPPVRPPDAAPPSAGATTPNAKRRKRQRQ